jgi:hypothetical protein
MAWMFNSAQGIGPASASRWNEEERLKPKRPGRAIAPRWTLAGMTITSPEKILIACSEMN